MSNLSALVGAVLFAWMPEDEHPHSPGPKFRPVLVIDADADSRRLKVAYGTSQRTGVNHKGEITFQQNEIPGLRKDTKFCLGQSKWIPLSAEFLSRSGQSSDLAILGIIPKSRSRALLLRIEELGGF